VAAHELRLVLEYCDRGSLGTLLKDYGGFRDEEGQLDYAAVLETAADIAKGMIHLHKNNICHNDLKANNVMFKSEGNDGRGVRAKVVDFGLSVKLDTTATHTSNAFQGTMTHMVSSFWLETGARFSSCLFFQAPEVMMEGKQSRAADVYSFGLTLWELITGGSPYKGGYLDLCLDCS
jgi:serine/threonine protein kinase